MKKIYILFLFFISILSFSEEIGIANIINPFKDINREFHREFEDNFIFAFSDISNFEITYFFREENIYNIKKELNKYKDNNIDNDLIKKIKEYDYSVMCDVLYYNIKEEPNFYDQDVIEYSAIIKFNIIIINGKNLKIIEEEEFTIETEKSRNRESIIQRLNFLIKEKLKKYKNSLLYFKKKIKILKKNWIFVWLNAGKQDNIKETDILIGYNIESGYLQEIAKLKVIKTTETNSVAIILFNNEEINNEITFLKKETSNIELQFAGGFSLSEIERENISLYPYADIRILIPVRLPFFNPVVNTELNFFFKNNKFIVPFSIETGIQADFNINRFKFGIGTLVGALFSPDENLQYQIDSIMVRPYIFISVILNSIVNLYFEFGYRYCNENILYNNWGIDIEGIYFTFGINLSL